MHQAPVPYLNDVDIRSFRSIVTCRLDHVSENKDVRIIPSMERLYTLDGFPVKIVPLS